MPSGGRLTECSILPATFVRRVRPKDLVGGASHPPSLVAGPLRDEALCSALLAGALGAACSRVENCLESPKITTMFPC